MDTIPQYSAKASQFSRRIYSDNHHQTENKPFSNSFFQNVGNFSDVITNNVLHYLQLQPWR